MYRSFLPLYRAALYWTFQQYIGPRNFFSCHQAFSGLYLRRSPIDYSMNHPRVHLKSRTCYIAPKKPSIYTPRLRTQSPANLVNFVSHRLQALFYEPSLIYISLKNLWTFVIKTLYISKNLSPQPIETGVYMIRAHKWCAKYLCSCEESAPKWIKY